MSELKKIKLSFDKPLKLIVTKEFLEFFFVM